MALNKQVYIYSLDTSAVYSNKEKRMHSKLSILHCEKKNNNLEIQKVLTELKHLGITNNKLRLIHSNRFDFSAHPETCKLQIFALIDRLKVLNEYRKLKNSVIRIQKFNLQKKFKDKEYHNSVLKNLTPKTVRILRDDVLKTNNVVAVFDSSLTRMLGMEIGELSLDIIIVKVFFFDVIKDIIKHGFYYQGEKYKYFTSSAGQIRTKKTVFIKESLWNKYEKTLMCGLTVSQINKTQTGKKVEKNGDTTLLFGINVNKFLAYLALSNSATEPWLDFDIDKTIVVSDFETKVLGTYDLINDQDYSITRTDGEVPVTHTDGCGMILPGVSTKNFMIRLPWIKGLLAVFDYKKFILKFRESLQDASIGIVTDIYGVKHDIIAEDIQIIFTESQFKTYKYYRDWEEYKQYFHQYNCTAGKCNEEEDKIKTATINYQMIQTLCDMTVPEIKTVAKNSTDKLEQLTSTVFSMLNVLGVTKYNNNKNYLQQSLEIYPELLQDCYTKDIITQVKKSLVKDYRSAKLEVRGKYTFLIPDLYAFCEHLFLHIEQPQGLLQNKEVFCKLYVSSKKLACLRSPHLYREWAIRNNVITDDIVEWFTTDAVYTSSYDLISKILQFDEQHCRTL